jgi:predicted nicotinamide N-methyase
MDLIRGKTILELGAGTGFLSILCAKHLGARFVLATDGSAEVISDLDSNIFLNGLESTNLIVPGMLKWGHTLSDELLNGPEDNRTYDLVLGADVVSRLLEAFDLIQSSYFSLVGMFISQILPFPLYISCIVVVILV